MRHYTPDVSCINQAAAVQTREPGCDCAASQMASEEGNRRQMNVTEPRCGRHVDVRKSLAALLRMRSKNSGAARERRALTIVAANALATRKKCFTVRFINASLNEFGRYFLTIVTAINRGRDRCGRKQFASDDPAGRSLFV
jgi:hypothetical protein